MSKKITEFAVAFFQVMNVFVCFGLMLITLPIVIAGIVFFFIQHNFILGYRFANRASDMAAVE